MNEQEIADIRATWDMLNARIAETETTLVSAVEAREQLKPMYEAILGATPNPAIPTPLYPSEATGDQKEAAICAKIREMEAKLDRLSAIVSEMLESQQ